MLFKLENIFVNFSNKKIFEKLDFIFNEGDKIGIIGENGCGKTTFFNIILEKIEFQGELIFNNKNYGYLSQDESFKELKLISERKKELENLLIEPEIINNIETYDKLLKEYNELVTNQFSTKEIWLINRFKFNKTLFNKEKKENLSGGETTKLKLIKLFSENYKYYLLDEPSNHLDIESKEILIKEILAKESFILISHDVDLLNKCCNKIGEIVDNKIKIHVGNYDDFKRFKEKEREELIKLQTEHKKAKNKIRENILNTKLNSSKKIKERTNTFSKGQVLRNLGTGRGGMESAIKETSKKINKWEEKLNSFNTPSLNKEGEISIHYSDFISKPNKIALEIKNLIKNFEDLNLNVASFTIMDRDKIALQGKNGSGKSTFLKLIVGEIKPDNGQIFVGDKIKLGYLSQKNENLNFNNTILEEIINLNINLDEGEIRKNLSKFLFKKEDVFKKIKDLSGGEKIRLEFSKLIFQESNLLLLDEPSNHLDIKSKEILAKALKKFPGPILVVSHDTYFLEKFVNKYVEIKNGEIQTKTI